MSNPHNPRLHPPYTIIDGINPDSPDSQQMEQIDQLNVFLLQDIDEKFSNFHQVITTRLIPAVKKFNAVSEPTREAAKFWRTFFEAAAAVRVPVPTDYQLDPTAPPSSSSISAQHDPNASLPESHPSQSSESSFFADLPRGGTSSTPLNSNRYQQGGVDDQGTPNSDFIMESPVERFSRLVQQDIEQDRSASSSMGSGSMYGAGGGGGGTRAKDPRDEVDYDSDLDSPDASFEDDQEAPTPQPQRQLHQQQQQPLGNSADALANLTISSSGLPNFPVPTHSTTSAYGRASSSNQNTATISHPQHPTSSFAQPRPSAATPRQARVAGGGGAGAGPLTPSNPFRSTPGQAAWNGLADLRSTPLTITSKPTHQHQHSQSRPQPSSSYRAGGRDSDSDSDEDNLWPKGMSPPRTMNFTMPPSAKKKDPERMVPVEVGRGGGIGERVKERLLAGAGGGGGAGQQGGMPTPPRPGAGARGPPGGGGRHFDIDDDEEDDYEEEDSIGGGGIGQQHHLSTIPGSVSSVASQQPYYASSIQSQQPPNSVSSNASSYRQQPQPHLLPNPSYSVSSSASGSHYSHAPQPTHEDDNDSSSSSNSSNDSDDLGNNIEGDLSLSHLDHHPPPSSLLPPISQQPLNLNLSSQGSLAGGSSLLSNTSYKAVPPQTELDESFDYSDEDDSRFEQEEEERRYLQSQQQQPQPQSQSQGAGASSSYLGAGSLGAAAAGRRTSNLINFDDPFAGGPGSGEGGARYGAGLNGGGASKKFGLLGARDEMLTFNGGRLEDAPLTESPTPFQKK